jgi:hypothetical protein
MRRRSVRFETMIIFAAIAVCGDPLADITERSHQIRDEGWSGLA